MPSMSSVGSPVSPQVTNLDAEGMQTAHSNFAEPEQAPLQVATQYNHNPFQRITQPDYAFDERREHHRGFPLLTISTLRANGVQLNLSDNGLTGFHQKEKSDGHT